MNYNLKEILSTTNRQVLNEKRSFLKVAITFLLYTFAVALASALFSASIVGEKIVIALMCSIVFLILLYLANHGMENIALKFVKGERITIKDCLIEKEKLIKLILVDLTLIAKVIKGLLFFIIPGIMTMLNLVQVSYVTLNDEKLTVKEILKRSEEIQKKRNIKVACLYFIGSIGVFVVTALFIFMAYSFSSSIVITITSIIAFMLLLAITVAYMYAMRASTFNMLNEVNICSKEEIENEVIEETQMETKKIENIPLKEEIIQSNNINYKEFKNENDSINAYINLNKTKEELIKPITNFEIEIPDIEYKDERTKNINKKVEEVSSEKKLNNDLYLEENYNIFFKPIEPEYKYSFENQKHVYIPSWLDPLS